MILNAKRLRDSSQNAENNVYTMKDKITVNHTIIVVYHGH